MQARRNEMEHLIQMAYVVFIPQGQEMLEAESEMLLNDEEISELVSNEAAVSSSNRDDQ